MASNPSELIVNEDGSIYHLHLKPGQMEDTIITVGDIGRVDVIAEYLDEIFIKTRHREFYTVSGRIGKKRLSIISTGIGTDNIDIVLQEADALFNMNFSDRTIKNDVRKLTFIRLGTSGGLQENIELESLVVSSWGLGLDGLGQFYPSLEHGDLKKSFELHMVENGIKLHAYFARGDEELGQQILPEALNGITASCTGFYGPQGRKMRIPIRYPNLPSALESYRPGVLEEKVTNFEMETAAIYLLSQLMGHRAVSINTILANRPRGTFSDNPARAVRNMVEKAMPGIEQLS